MRTATFGLPACVMLITAVLSTAGRAQSHAPEPDYTNENAGLARGVHPETLTWDRIYALALVRVRTRRGAFSPALDTATLEQEALRLGVTDFARFRLNFHSNGPFHDPGPTVLELYGRLLAIENTRRNVWFHESLHKLVSEQSRGNTSGLDRLDAETAEAALLRVSMKLADDIRQFRDALDELRFLLGLSPRAPVALDRQNIAAFPAAFDAVDAWCRNAANRRSHELPEIIDRLPVPGEVIVSGEPILEKIEKNPDRYEEFLAKAAQLALKSRSERDQIPTQPNSGIQLEMRVRRQIRDLHDKRLAYQAEKRRYALAIRVKDEAFERLTAPPSPTVRSRSSLLQAVIDDQTEVTRAQARLISLWTSFRAGRLALYHDLGVLPYNDWKSFLADLRATSSTTPNVPAKPPGDIPQPPALPNPPRS
jgi:hypothetical protein